MNDFNLSHRIELNVGYVENTQGIHVPLGSYHRGKWSRLAYVWENDSLELTPEDLTLWLVHEHFFGLPLIESEDIAATFVNETIERCQALAKAHAAVNKVTSFPDA